MSYCLIKPLADAFRKALKDGRIDPEKLAGLSSEERHAFFADIIGEDNAGKVNALFESKLLQNDVEQGMINWAKQVTGIKPEVRNDLISRIQKMKPGILNPADEKAFLEDLASRRLGTEVTLEEAKQITELSNNLAKAKENIPTDRLAYGAARVQLENYLNDIKRENGKIKLADFRTNPAGSATRVVSGIAGFAKSMKATLDVSALGRQGFKAAFTHPRQWASGAAKTFLDVYNTLRTKTTDDGVMNAIKADIYSRDNAIDGTYKRMKLDIGTGEEAYPTSLPERIPAFGRLFKASEVAYQGFLMRLRADVADRYIKTAIDNGVDLKDPFQAQAIGRLVNSLTGRGNLGPFENSGKAVNAVFFSPKSVKANFDFLTAHALEKTSGFARKQAAINLLKVLGGMAAILATAKAVKQDSVETDARSADFGKIRVGDTRFDISAGMSSIVTLATRLIERSSKSSISGKVSDLGTGFGQTSPIELLTNFAENKLAPVAALLRDLLNGTDSQGNPLTVQGEASNLLMPLPVTNAKEVLGNPNAAPAVVAILADALGIATNTYSDQSSLANILGDNKELLKNLHDLSNSAGQPLNFTNWNSSKSANLAAFKAKFGEREYKSGAERYAFQVKTRLEALMQNPKYQKLSDADKVKAVNQVNTDALDKVFSQFNFKYKKLPYKKINIK